METLMREKQDRQTLKHKTLKPHLTLPLTITLTSETTGQRDTPLLPEIRVRVKVRVRVKHVLVRGGKVRVRLRVRLGLGLELGFGFGDRLGYG
eukprot:1377688-Amorphochlora_amoeboformis.AAC.1